MSTRAQQIMAAAEMQVRETCLFQGEQEGMAAVLLKFVRQRFGQLPLNVQSFAWQADQSDLRFMLEKALDASSLDEFCVELGMFGITPANSGGLAARCLAEGQALGRKDALRHLLLYKFGALPKAIQERLASGSPAEIDAWAIAVVAAPSMEAVFAAPS